MNLVIAIDGTAACGKGTLARGLARHFGFAHLDSGALYRLVGLGVLDASADPASEVDAVRAAHAIDHQRINDPRLRSVAVGQAASQVAAIQAVRDAIFQYQRDFAASPPGGAKGAIIDGRDIGTVICPDAPAKLFIDARPCVRAGRRFRELQGAGASPLPDIAAVEAELLARDARDRARAIAPLKQAADAVLLDTSDLDIDAAFKAALALVESRLR